MYVGIDIGGTNLKFGLVTEAGQVSAKGKRKTPHDLEILLQTLVEIVNNFETAVQETAEQILGVGISAPGIIQKDGTMTTGGAIRSLYGINLKAELEARLGLPVYVENDANAAAVAEQWRGNAQGIENYLCIVLGTGVGGGIIINNQVYRGAHGMAGEFGFMMIRDLPENIEDASVNYRGSVVGGLVRLYNQALREKNPDAELVLSGKEIFDRARAGEETAKTILEDFYQDLAVCLVNLISAFDPELILIGGAISENSVFMEGVNRKVFEIEKGHNSLRYLMDKTLAPIQAAGLKNDAGLIGAVYQVHRQIKAKAFS